jgi:glycosyltransferase involved in cell wall biosynthesis
MRILIYTHAFAPSIGGVETYVMLLAQGLAQTNGTSNLQVTVLTPTPAGAWDDAALPFRVVRQPSWVKLLRAIRHADVVHLAGPCLAPMLLAWIFRKPVVVEHHGYQTVCPNGMLLYEPGKTVCPGHFVSHRYHQCLQCHAASVGWLKSLSHLLLVFPRRWLSARVTRNLPISQHVSGRLGLPRSEVIYYGIPDLRRVASVAGQCLPKPSANAHMTFAYVGRFVSEKGAQLLVEAAQRLQRDGCHFRLKLIGDGPQRARLESDIEASGLGERVVLTGYLQGEAMESALGDVSVVVMPSICEETAGLAAIEQMMRGRLVIAADIGGLGEVVGPAGLKFPPGDVDALASCLKRVLDQPGLVQVLGEKARQRALELFRQERMVDEHLTLYHQLVLSQ